MNIIKCQGVNCDVKSSCSRYYPIGVSVEEGKSFIVVAKSLHTFFKSCLFLKKK